MRSRRTRENRFFFCFFCSVSVPGASFPGTEIIELFLHLNYFNLFRDDKGSSTVSFVFVAGSLKGSRIDKDWEHERASIVVINIKLKQ